MSEIKPGDELTWIHEPRGGYGYSYPVDAKVVRVGRSRVTIEVRRKSGEVVHRSVHPGKLRKTAPLY